MGDGWYLVGIVVARLNILRRGRKKNKKVEKIDFHLKSTID